MGGAPRKHAPPEWDGALAPDGLTWMSAEGQSDYYATSSCFRKLIAFEKKPATYEINPPAVLVRLCKTQWKNDDEISVCIRAGLGAKNFLNLTFEFPISFETPSKHVTDTTLSDEYPARQCRLDTLVAGALCPDQLPLRFNLFNAQAQLCTIKAGLRPRCWYASGPVL